MAPPAQHLPDPLPGDPRPILRSWFDQAARERIQPNPDSMMLATVDSRGRPTARIVLCKKIEPEYVVFFTNYQSAKGTSLAVNPTAALLMHWDLLERQVRIEGPVIQSPTEESDEYFESRPWTSRIGAWASDQSRPLGSRAEMIERVRQTMRRFGVDPDKPPPDAATVEIPRPPHWGGYRVFFERIELWVSGAGRVHDRGVWERELYPAGPRLFEGGPWRANRLQP